MSKIGFLKTLWERKNNKNNKLGKVLKETYNLFILFYLIIKINTQINYICKKYNIIFCRRNILYFVENFLIIYAVIFLSLVSIFCHSYLNFTHLCIKVIFPYCREEDNNIFSVLPIHISVLPLHIGPYTLYFSLSIFLKK